MREIYKGAEIKRREDNKIRLQSSAVLAVAPSQNSSTNQRNLIDVIGHFNFSHSTLLYSIRLHHQPNYTINPITSLHPSPTQLSLPINQSINQSTTNNPKKTMGIDPAAANRSLSTIRTELEFLRDSGLLNPAQFQSIMSQLPVRISAPHPLFFQKTGKEIKAQNNLI